MPFAVKAGSSSPSVSPSFHKRNNNNYDIFVVCGSCHSSKAFSRKHNAYLCPFCDKGGEELLFPIQEIEEEELEQERKRKNLDLPDLGVRYSTTDGKTLDKPTTYTSINTSAGSGQRRSKAVYQVNNAGGGSSRTFKEQKSDFDRTCELDDRQLAAKGGITIISDEIIRDKSRNVLDPSELEALEKGRINNNRRSRNW